MENGEWTKGKNGEKIRKRYGRDMEKFLFSTSNLC